MRLGILLLALLALPAHAQQIIGGNIIVYAASGAGEAITVNAPVNQAPSATYASWGGTWSGGTSPSNVDIALSTSNACPGTGTFTTLGGSFTVGSPWSSTGTSALAGSAGDYYACARKTNLTSTVSSPTLFHIETLTATNPGTLTAGGSYTQAGTYSAGTGAPAALDYSFDGTGCGSSASSPTISGGNFSWSNTAPAAGTHTISICDHANHAVVATSTSFTVNSAAAYPLDAQSGASACYFMAPCSSAIAGAGTQVAVSITRTSDSHVCDIKVGSSPGTLATTVSGCSTSGDNGTTITSWCAATTCNASTNSSSPGQALRDQTGNGNDQNVTGTLAFTASCSGSNYCYTPPGATGNVIGNGNLSGATMIGSVFTIVAWVKPTQLNSGTFYEIQGSFARTGRPELRLDGQAGNATAKLVFNIEDTIAIGTSTCTISVNAWHSIALTYDVSGNYAFYADGATCGSGTNLQTINWSTDFPLFLQSGFGGTAVNPFFGSIRGIVIYKSALAAATVEAVMNTGP